jgi:hypothetical protein
VAEEKSVERYHQQLSSGFYFSVQSKCVGGFVAGQIHVV